MNAKATVAFLIAFIGKCTLTDLDLHIGLRKPAADNKRGRETLTLSACLSPSVFDARRKQVHFGEPVRDFKRPTYLLLFVCSTKQRWTLSGKHVNNRWTRPASRDGETRLPSPSQRADYGARPWITACCTEPVGRRAIPRVGSMANVRSGYRIWSSCYFQSALQFCSRYDCFNKSTDRRWFDQGYFLMTYSIEAKASSEWDWRGWAAFLSMITWIVQCAMIRKAIWIWLGNYNGSSGGP